MITLPAMSDAQAASWHGLMDVYERLPTGWTLIGGQMVHLHCAERGSFPPRPTDDIDAVIDVLRRMRVVDLLDDGVVGVDVFEQDVRDLVEQREQHLVGAFPSTGQPDHGVAVHVYRAAVDLGRGEGVGEHEPDPDVAESVGQVVEVLGGEQRLRQAAGQSLKLLGAVGLSRRL